MTTKQKPPGGRTGGPGDERRASGYVASKVPRRPTGCPCGCRTRLPYLDDPACVRHRPLSVDLALYDRAEVDA